VSRLRTLGAAALLALAVAWPHGALAQERVLRYAFVAAETGFDPAQINDLYSRIVTSHIFDGLYDYDPLARPFVIRPNTAEAMPVTSDDFRTWTVRIRPGIYFADDPAFKGKRRELVAQDYVYSWKRFFDPANKSPVYSTFKEEGVLGVDALRDQALKDKVPFDYDREVEGIRALDRYTIQFRLEKPRPRFLYTLATGDLYGAVAREAVEFYRDKIMEHPVGTGPFRLASWRRSSQLVLERNPGFREVTYDAQPAADDAEGQAILAKLRGRRLPIVDRVEVSIIEASQPRWLAFLQDRFDLVNVPLEFAALAVPNGRLAPNLARRGIGLNRIVSPDRVLYYFNMEDPVIGGFAPERVALRRAIRLATDVGKEIRTVRRGQAIPAQTIVAPGSWGYDAAYKSENSDFDPARAKALLDLYGYVDRDGDGWREAPDGKPLVLRYASQPDELSRQFDELWKKNMDAVGLRLSIDRGQWPEQLKAARAGQLMIWQLGYSAASPDGADALQLLYGPAAGGQNLARFRHERLDAIVRGMQELPDGPARMALLREGQKIVDAFAPHKYTVHRIVNDLTQPWLVGYRRPLYGNQFWQYVDVDPARRPPLR
jgi:ABC-type transport system substrate-binding protein